MIRFEGDTYIGKYSFTCNKSSNPDIVQLQTKLIELHNDVIDMLETIHHTKDFHDDVNLLDYLRAVSASVDTARQDFENHHESWQWFSPDGYVDPDDRD